MMKQTGYFAYANVRKSKKKKKKTLFYTGTVRSNKKPGGNHLTNKKWPGFQNFFE